MSQRLEGWSRAVAIVSAAALVRLVFAVIVPALPDETYYWVWSRHLSAGYFDHPPGIALLIRAGGALLAPAGLSATSLGVRLGPIVAGWVAALSTAAIARRLAGDGAAVRAAIVMSILPFAAAGLILATPDSPLLSATGVGLYCVVRALESPVRSVGSLKWWVAAGVALGLAFCSKYTSIFLPVGVVLAILLRRDLRQRLAEPGPYVACVVATLIFLPVLSWNAQHDWISFVYQVQHGLSTSNGSWLVAAWRHEGDFLGGQAALVSPILFVLIIIAVVRSLRRSSPGIGFVLGIVASLSFLFFVYSAFRHRVEPNWPSPAYVPAVALLATVSWTGAGAWWYRKGCWLAAALSVVIYIQALIPILPIDPTKDPVARAYGWDDLAAEADRMAGAASFASKTTTWLAADRYQEASVMSFYTPSHPPTFALNLAGRPNEYDLLPKFPSLAARGDNLVLALDESIALPQEFMSIAPFFTQVQRGERVTLMRGNGVVGIRRLWLFQNWNGSWIKPAE